MCRADFEIDVLAAGFTAQGGVMMRHLSIAIGLAATLVLSSSSSFAAEEARAMLENRRHPRNLRL